MTPGEQHENHPGHHFYPAASLACAFKIGTFGEARKGESGIKTRRSPQPVLSAAKGSFFETKALCSL
jgi:hypothetical protein